MAKRKKQRVIIRAADHGRAYMGIGHTSANDFVWVYAGGTIMAWSAGREKSLHADVIGGKECEFYWRGRVDVFRREISYIPPSGTKYQSIPSWLADKLEARFGTGYEYVGFNPPSRRR